jgi:hypothetical protein
MKKDAVVYVLTHFPPWAVALGVLVLLVAAGAIWLYLDSADRNDHYKRTGSYVLPEDRIDAGRWGLTFGGWSFGRDAAKLAIALNPVLFLAYLVGRALGFRSERLISAEYARERAWDALGFTVMGIVILVVGGILAWNMHTRNVIGAMSITLLAVFSSVICFYVAYDRASSARDSLR